ncbi:MAG: aminomethyl-transferring glycine dehydrogenase subunit GcvPA [Thermotoga sp.]|nr:MAG: aminomethyl-transferring glycine dehydrogenase subunit GcvPA [Thermotoga sp.]
MGDEQSYRSYIPHTDEEIKTMLDEIGVSSIDELFELATGKKGTAILKLDRGMNEWEILKKFEKLADENMDFHFGAIFMGGGIYNHFIPSALLEIANRGEFLTAYTPYQPEISQGTLQALFEYQTMICELTGMEVSNSSMYDGASALAEAVLMGYRLNQKKKVIISKTVHPEYRDVVKTYSQGLGIRIREINYDEGSGMVNFNELFESMDDETSSVVLQYPNFFGVLEDIERIGKKVKEKGNVILIVVSNPIALSILEPPGSFGADIVVGEGQPLGNTPNFGGPGFGFFATREKFLRKMPGRLIGETVDTSGNTGYVMTFQTREQHIRREKATSNICSNHAHNAVMAAIYLSLLGSDGLRKVAENSVINAHYLLERIENAGYNRKFDSPFFNEFAVECHNLDKLNRELLKNRILGPLDLGKFYPELRGVGLFCATELTRSDDIEALIEVMKGMK